MVGIVSVPRRKRAEDAMIDGYVTPQEVPANRLNRTSREHLRAKIRSRESYELLAAYNLNSR